MFLLKGFLFFFYLLSVLSGFIIWFFPHIWNCINHTHIHVPIHFTEFYSHPSFLYWPSLLAQLCIISKFHLLAALFFFFPSSHWYKKWTQLALVLILLSQGTLENLSCPKIVQSAILASFWNFCCFLQNTKVFIKKKKGNKIHSPFLSIVEVALDYIRQCSVPVKGELQS